MASVELSARLRYLSDSAHLLAATAPATSKHLMSRHNALLFENGLDPSEEQKRRTCGACGTILIIGWEGSMKIQHLQSRQKNGKNGKNDVPAKAMVYTCDCCGRKTRQPITTSSQRYKIPSRSSKSIISSTALHSTDTHSRSTVPTPESSNSSSKKRAKNRKHGGLSAILAKQQSLQGATASGFGLDLKYIPPKVTYYWEINDDSAENTHEIKTARPPRSSHNKVMVDSPSHSKRSKDKRGKSSKSHHKKIVAHSSSHSHCSKDKGPKSSKPNCNQVVACSASPSNCSEDKAPESSKSSCNKVKARSVSSNCSKTMEVQSSQSSDAQITTAKSSKHSHSKRIPSAPQGAQDSCMPSEGSQMTAIGEEIDLRPCGCPPDLNRETKGKAQAGSAKTTGEQLPNTEGCTCSGHDCHQCSEFSQPSNPAAIELSRQMSAKKQRRIEQKIT
ncbi:hypothetical protein G7Y89_g1079 [Cudoniella acicularis]|uniref:Uncharacterized protein n=1 Tax=Cudoniella acicularis TaxID=354080 RepID=A0A8H4RVZ7_9HELO|nr:hypothetical protein G7Y89_g1079 [Cudoniella acicularis]